MTDLSTPPRSLNDALSGLELRTKAFINGEALRIANDTVYGLAAAIWTDDITTPTAPHARSGPVWSGSTALTRAT